MQNHPYLLALLFICLSIALAMPSQGQDTSDRLGKALSLVRQVETPTGHPPDAEKISLLTQAITEAQQAPNHRLKGHRVLAIQALRSAIAEIGKGDPSHQAPIYLHTADQELGTSISLAGATPPVAGLMTSAAPVPTAQTADDFFKQGWAEMHQSNWRGAVAAFDQAIKLDPAKVDAYLERGASKLMLGDQAGGMADYDQAVKIDPKNTEPNLKLVEALQMKDPKAALAAYNQVLALNPKNEEAYKGIATVHWIHQEYEATIMAYNQLITLDPKDSYYYGVRALAKAAKGDLDGAIADNNQDIFLDPKDFNAFHNRADLKKKKGDFPDALADLNQAITLGMHEGYVYRQRADIRKEMGDLDGALEDYNQVISLDPKASAAFDDVDVYISRGDIKLAKKDFDGAIADYNQYLRLDRNDAEITYFNIWTAQNLQGKKSDADAQLFREMTNSLGFHWYWRGNIAAFLLGQINETDFMKAATSSNAKETGLSQAWYYAGMKQFLAGNKAAAAEDFRKCLAANPRDERTAFLAQAELKIAGQ